MRDKNNWAPIEWTANEGFIATLRVLIKHKGLALYLNNSQATEEVQQKIIQIMGPDGYQDIPDPFVKPKVRLSNAGAA